MLKYLNIYGIFLNFYYLILSLLKNIVCNYRLYITLSFKLYIVCNILSKIELKPLLVFKINHYISFKKFEFNFV